MLDQAPSLEEEEILEFEPISPPLQLPMFGSVDVYSFTLLVLLAPDLNRPQLPMFFFAHGQLTWVSHFKLFVSMHPLFLQLPVRTVPPLATSIRAHSRLV